MLSVGDPDKKSRGRKDTEIAEISVVKTEHHSLLTIAFSRFLPAVQGQLDLLAQRWVVG